jgi:hypothetical protein
VDRLRRVYRELVSACSSSGLSPSGTAGEPGRKVRVRDKGARLFCSFRSRDEPGNMSKVR